MPSSKTLIRKVNKVLQVISNFSSNCKVEFDFSSLKAKIYINPELEKTGNGHNRFFPYDLDTILCVCKQGNIKFKIGVDENFYMHILIYEKVLPLKKTTT